MAKYLVHEMNHDDVVTWRILDAWTPSQAAHKAEQDISEPNWIRVMDDQEKVYEFPGSPVLIITGIAAEPNASSPSA